MSGGLPGAAWIVALSSLPSMGPARLRSLLATAGPAEAWAIVAAGRAHTVVALDGRLGPDPLRLSGRWRSAAAAVDVAAVWQAHAGCQVLVHGGPEYPAVLAADPDPPPVLFACGRTDLLARPLVAVVGTRSCTRAGFETARELGHELALAGVCVVSGLALGIDGAAHRGALDARPADGAAPPVGVVASGLDVVYPLRHRDLWRSVADAGLLLSESPLGSRPARWRFPARNRIVAGMSRAVVVVESSARGGSMYTAEEALDRGVPLLAFPGQVRSPAAEGTNKLLFDGAGIARDAADVLGAIGIHVPTRRGPAQQVLPGTGPSRAGAGQDVHRVVLGALGWEPATLDQIMARSGLGLGALSQALTELEGAGRVSRLGMWFEQVRP